MICSIILWVVDVVFNDANGVRALLGLDDERDDSDQPYTVDVTLPPYDPSKVPPVPDFTDTVVEPWSRAKCPIDILDPKCESVGVTYLNGYSQMRLRNPPNIYLKRAAAKDTNGKVPMFIPTTTQDAKLVLFGLPPFLTYLDVYYISTTKDHFYCRVLVSGETPPSQAIKHVFVSFSNITPMEQQRVQLGDWCEYNVFENGTYIQTLYFKAEAVSSRLVHQFWIDYARDDENRINMCGSEMDPSMCCFATSNSKDMQVPQMCVTKYAMNMDVSDIGTDVLLGHMMKTIIANCYQWNIPSQSILCFTRS